MSFPVVSSHHGYSRNGEKGNCVLQVTMVADMAHFLQLKDHSDRRGGEADG
jgi:hypothetical protein